MAAGQCLKARNGTPGQGRLDMAGNLHRRPNGAHPHHREHAAALWGELTVIFSETACRFAFMPCIFVTYCRFLTRDLANTFTESCSKRFSDNPTGR